MTRHAYSWYTAILLTTAIATYSHLSSAFQSTTGDVSFSSGSVLSTIDVSSSLLVSCQTAEAIPCVALNPQWLRNTDQQHHSVNASFDRQSNSTSSNSTRSHPNTTEHSRRPLISLDPGQTTQYLTSLKRWIDQRL